jgi:hypothetical protein
MSKYNNTITELDGHKFHSKKEGMYYMAEIKPRIGKDIRNVVLQPKFKVKARERVLNPNEGKHICTFTADFQFDELFDGKWVTRVIDVKNSYLKKTDSYTNLRIKLAEIVYDMKVEVIT